MKPLASILITALANLVSATLDPSVKAINKLIEATNQGLNRLRLEIIKNRDARTFPQLNKPLRNDASIEDILEREQALADRIQVRQSRVDKGQDTGVNGFLIFEDQGEISNLKGRLAQKLREKISPAKTPEGGDSTAGKGTRTDDTAPLSEALTVLQKKLEEGLCPAVEGLAYPL